MAWPLDREGLRRLWESALSEDGLGRDVTSEVAIDRHVATTACIVARQQGVYTGSAVFDVLREAYVNQLTLNEHLTDGSLLEVSTVIATLAGSMRLLLGIERTLLNFLQRLCGVATLTRKYVDAVAGTNAKIFDTRKTIPGWRQLDKYAVRCGGGHNHRMGLHDAILVKDNHLSGIGRQHLAATASEIISKIGSLNPPPGFVEFEVDTLEQLDELLKVGGIDVILLDNFTPDQMREAVAHRDAAGLTGKIELEASGNIRLENIRQIAETGIDRISIGAITHSAPAPDITMEINP